jgi:hypothetical protein
MSKQLYDRLTTGSVVVAVVSSLLFERVGQYGALMGVLGILAGAVAAAAYFCNQFQVMSTRKEGSPAHFAGTKHTKVFPPLTVVGRQGWPTPRDINEPTLASPYEILRTLGHGSYGLVFRTTHLRNVGHWRLTISEKPSDKFADQVVEIVDRLCSMQAHSAFEFVLTRDGNFLIRQKRGAAAWTGGMESSLERESDPLLPFPEKVN